ncbi:SprT family zinc-dependent metalloprotease [Crocosphaera sp. UHCC 0190]|uniref:M48 family metallopeptidase n=1 Tax=Crocosphaera sp. UHCC 0190 TaxID=3110246 RepID=UPI002B20B11F|nr:SprT family zinc-dependent metalloprotease [Crocosphaera sp. UHCC 0190]MEA5511495.1 SprT family zinc-dependent metalloprotease [Crocosphaera sp. UHCC 0190]
MHQITLNDLIINVTRKKIKNLHLTVHPPDGEVRISAPLHLNDETIRLFAISKLHWIKKNQAKFKNQPRQNKKKFISGETHYYQGKLYLLNVIYDIKIPKVEIRNNTYLDLYVREGSEQNQREQTLINWYRQQLKAEIPAIIRKWEEIMQIEVKEWGVKKMKTKWGTCNIQAQRIWLNLELIKTPKHCLEYVIVHEMTHFFERHHNEKFRQLMDQFLPHWSTYKEELNQTPLEPIK